MAQSTGVVLAVGGITLANEVIFAPLAKDAKSKPQWGTAINWRVIPATIGLALALAGLERAAPGLALGLAWLSMLTVLVVRFGKAPTPLENVLKVMGY